VSLPAILETLQRHPIWPTLFSFVTGSSALALSFADELTVWLRIGNSLVALAAGTLGLMIAIRSFREHKAKRQPPKSDPNDDLPWNHR
jgi:hypothetical protein